MTKVTILFDARTHARQVEVPEGAERTRAGALHVRPGRSTVVTTDELAALDAAGVPCRRLDPSPAPAKVPRGPEEEAAFEKKAKVEAEEAEKASATEMAKLLAEEKALVEKKVAEDAAKKKAEADAKKAAAAKAGKGSETTAG